jgi:hypothetical protein
MTDAETPLADSRALFLQQAQEHIQIINARRNSRGQITAIAHHNTATEMALLSRDASITAARLVHKGVIDVEGNESWESLKIHTILLVRYLGKGTKGLQNLRKEIKAEICSVMIAAPVQWPSHSHTIKER